jgi:transcriptional regulator with XRE-family HTH domain
MSEPAAPRPLPEYAVRLRRILHEEGLSQEQFGALFGVTGKTIWRWSNGLNSPLRKHARELAKRYGGHWSDYSDFAPDTALDEVAAA